jgi:4'-phosphopantetheinyl transferase
VLVRAVLSRYAPVPPKAWAFRRGNHGRPEISRPEDIPPLRFNLSHTDGLVACLVALDRDVGVDVESVERRAQPLQLAEWCLGPSELASLRALHPATQLRRFFEYWTIKESYVKARGLGLSLPCKDVVVHFDTTTPRLSFGHRVQDSPKRWQVALLRPTSGHVIAAVIQRKGGADVALRVRSIPLVTLGIVQ